MWGWYVDPATLAKIRDMGVFVINYSWDDTTSFYGRRLRTGWSGTADLASVVDFTLTSSRDSCQKYENEGGSAYFWPEGANTYPDSSSSQDYLYDVSFVGACYGYRPILIHYLRKHNINVATFGAGWKSPIVNHGTLLDIYRRSRVNIGFSGMGHMLRVTHLKGRDFEVPMTGSLYLTSPSPDLGRCYRIGSEVLTYSSKRDCLATIRWALQHCAEADHIRTAGKARALKDHTWLRRVEQLLAYTQNTTVNSRRALHVGCVPVKAKS